MKQCTRFDIFTLWWRRSYWIYSGVWILLLIQCSWNQSPWYEWHYIIPDGYTGFLAIQYNCPGGAPLLRQGQRIIVQFDRQGRACTSESQFLSTGPVPTAATLSGVPIPYVRDSRAYTGYAVCCGHAFGMSGETLENPGPALLLDMLWVGYLKPRPSTDPEAPGDLREFLRTRFGIKPID